MRNTPMRDFKIKKNGRMAELVYCSDLLNRRGLKSTVSSNLTSSAISYHNASSPSGSRQRFLEPPFFLGSNPSEADFLSYFFSIVNLRSLRFIVILTLFVSSIGTIASISNDLNFFLEGFSEAIL